MSTSSSEPAVLVVEFPAGPGFLRICRVNASTLAAEEGFDIDELDDLRLAITEVANWLVADDDAGGTVRLELSVADGALRLIGSRLQADDLAVREVDDLVDAVLAATVSSYEFDTAARRVTLVKERASLDA